MIPGNLDHLYEDVGGVCLCPTFAPSEFGHLLSEAVYSFVLQKPTSRKNVLLIWNESENELLRLYGEGISKLSRDLGEYTFWPGVQIIAGTYSVMGSKNLICVVNDPKKCPSLGDKYNRMVEFVQRCMPGEDKLLLPWEHDDISLSGRLTDAYQRCDEESRDYYNPTAYWFYQKHLDTIADTPWSGIVSDYNVPVGHMASVYTLKAWKAVGGYPSDCRQDAGMHAKLKAGGRMVPVAELHPCDFTYIYRWGMSKYHLSTNTDIWHRQFSTHPKGTVVDIQPGFTRDWNRVNEHPVCRGVCS